MLTSNRRNDVTKKLKYVNVIRASLSTIKKHKQKFTSLMMKLLLKKKLQVQ